MNKNDTKQVKTIIKERTASDGNNKPLLDAELVNATHIVSFMFSNLFIIILHLWHVNFKHHWRPKFTFKALAAFVLFHYRKRCHLGQMDKNLDFLLSVNSVKCTEFNKLVCLVKSKFHSLEKWYKLEIDRPITAQSFEFDTGFFFYLGVLKTYLICNECLPNRNLPS